MQKPATHIVCKGLSYSFFCWDVVSTIQLYSLYAVFEWELYAGDFLFREISYVLKQPTQNESQYFSLFLPRPDHVSPETSALPSEPSHL